MSTKLYNIESPFGGDNQEDEYMKEIAELFITHVPSMSEELVSAGKSRNWQQVYFNAHKIKASIDLLDVTEIKDLIRTVEQQAKNERCVEELPEMIGKVNDIILECTQQLKEDFNL